MADIQFGSGGRADTSPHHGDPSISRTAGSPLLQEEPSAENSEDGGGGGIFCITNVLGSGQNCHQSFTVHILREMSQALIGQMGIT